MLYSIIDRMFIGNIPEICGVALAGVGVFGPIVTLLSSFGILIGLGWSILMAMRMGAKEMAEARRLMANSTVMLAMVSLLLTVIFCAQMVF
ncbi:MATE family efflux transporter [Eubacterium aggregans]|uniref:MATE family efflux transporter n=1 Tax=Eubacterium aggregans TaxID=81409 RepID=UPI003F3EE787